MNRTPLKPRTKPLARKPLRRSRSKRATTSPDWAIRAGECCAVCSEPAMDAHHIIEKGILRRYVLPGHRPSLHAAILSDPRNRLPLCRVCHAAHHAAIKSRLTLELLEREAPGAFIFANKCNLRWWLERRYPREKGRTA